MAGSSLASNFPSLVFQLSAGVVFAVPPWSWLVVGVAANAGVNHEPTESGYQPIRAHYYLSHVTGNHEHQVSKH